MIQINRSVGWAACLVLLAGCKPDHTDQVQAPPFELLRKDVTGLDFQNQLYPSSEFNVFNYMYFFNGGGLAAADFNNDGLNDLYFTNNMGPNKLFLNEGGMKFRDVTGQAGVAGLESWSSGATAVDINNDGMMDIYVGHIGNYKIMQGRNELFVCKRIENGVPVYEEEAIQYGLDLIGFSTQAAFFDYDRDGDLDLFQLNHSLHENGTFGQKKTFQGTLHPESGDKLLRNDNGKFVDVTPGSGINSTVIGYGLGVAIGDINLDGWPDIYVGNDFHENDYLYINLQNGTFREVLTDQMMHTSRFSMGVDVADLNNDGWSEIFSLDMHPEKPEILKASLGEDEYGIFQFKLGYGYIHQYARNTLQLNNGNGTFSEIGRYAGIYATDWSWAPLFFDFDHDGYKDLFISNGIPRRMNDIDYVNFRANSELRWKQNTNNLEEEDLVLVEKMPQIKLPNKFFRNAGDLTFQDLTGAVRNGSDSFSNGAAFVDLDNDGDLDVVVNNLEDEPFLYRNLSMESKKENRHFIHLHLSGSPSNIQAIGARVIVRKRGEDGKVQILTAENFPVRGYQSSMPAEIHIGIGEVTGVQDVLVIWPDGTYEALQSIEYDRKMNVSWKPGLPDFDFSANQLQSAVPFEFEEVSGKVSLDYLHEENPFVEFHREGLIPHMVSSEGPALAVADVNGDGLEDVFFGSCKFGKSALYYQQANGTFLKQTPASIERDSVFEDVAAAWVDLDGDLDLDLVIAAGGNEFWDKQEAMKQRAYLNEGNGVFTRLDFPDVYMTASCVLPADYDADGDVDLFYGARAVPWKYGLTPTSVLLRNDGNGIFTNATREVSNDLEEAGLVKNGCWTDMDGDNDPDLVLVVEWEPITIFYNQGGKLEKKPVNDMKGWWNFALPHDFDGDGDIDLLAGNLGKNSKFQPTQKEPVRIYINDFDDNDQVEQVLTYYLGGREFPFANFMEITKRLPPLKKKYLYASDFARSSPAEIFGEEKLRTAVVREINTLQSMYFENTGAEKGFVAHPLPAALQFSDQKAVCLADLDQDGREEVLMGGNFYESNIEMGRYDADYGHVLQFDKNGDMTVMPLGSQVIKGQVRRIVPIVIQGKKHYIFARNDDPAWVLKIVDSGQHL